MRHKEPACNCIVDHLAERTAHHVQLQAIFLSLEMHRASNQGMQLHGGP